MDTEIIFYHKNRRGDVFDKHSNEANNYDKIRSFRLKEITGFNKKNTHVELQAFEEPDVDMAEVKRKKKETLSIIYTERGRLAYFYFLNQKDMKPTAANINHYTARK